MDASISGETINEYEDQLNQINYVLEQCKSDEERQELYSLKANIEELLSLTSSKSVDNSDQQVDNSLDAEFVKFQSEIANLSSENYPAGSSQNTPVEYLDGTDNKCRAPFERIPGHIEYFNAIIVSSADSDNNVQVLFTNPVIEKMLPCPYLFKTTCKYEANDCRYSHGHSVATSELRPYLEPDFDSLVVGSFVLARDSDEIWRRATIAHIEQSEYFIQWEKSSKVQRIDLQFIFPLNVVVEHPDDEQDVDLLTTEDVINTSLLIDPASQALGNWEKHTKGIGSRLMAKMGYITGTGLGKNSRGRLEPVTAVVLPSGKSLDYCMDLRQRIGGGKSDFFSVERKMKRMLKKQEIRNAKVYASESAKVNMFDIINNVLTVAAATPKANSSEKHLELKKQTNRDINIEYMKNMENMKQIEIDVVRIEQSLYRHSDPMSQVNKSLKAQLISKQKDLEKLKVYSHTLSSEQQRRSDKKKMTIF